MVGTLGSEPIDLDELETAVRDELVALRGAHGRLTAQKFSAYPSLRLVCGADDLLDAYFMFERELKRYITHGNRNEVAAALSISAQADTVLDRLEKVASHFEERGQARDQRSARRWSDHGFRTIAAELVAMADVRGRLGRELVTIEISGNRETGLHLILYQLTSKQLDEQAPLIRLWKHQGDDMFEQSKGLSVEFDLEQVEPRHAANDEYKLKRYDIEVELPVDLGLATVDVGDAVYSISIEGRDAPIRTMTFLDQSQLGDDLLLRFTTYRTIATVEVVKGSPIR